MTGLGRVQDKTRPQDAFELMVLRGVENLTNSLRRGHPFSPKALGEMQQLRRRLDAFGQALDERLAIQEEVTE